MASNLTKILLSTGLFTIVGGAVAVGAIHHWVQDPHMSEELIERGWIKPHAKLEKGLSDPDMGAVFDEAQRAGELSSDDGREHRGDHYRGAELITLSNADVELLNERYLARIEAKKAASQPKPAQSQAQKQEEANQQALADDGWGSDTSF